MTTYTYTTISSPLGTAAALSGINDKDETVGSYSDGAFVYSNGVYTTINDPLGTGTQAHGINNHGQIVRVYNDPSTGGTQGFLYSGGVHISIIDPLEPSKWLSLV
jgi:probable HAF family extracellular repeat protein